MFAGGLVAVAVGVVLVLTVIGVLVRVFTVAGGQPPPTRVPGVGGRWRLVLAVRLVALLVGVGIAVWLWTRDGGLGRGAMLSAAALGLCVLVGTAVGETIVKPAVDPGPRSASLAPRRVVDYLPRSARLVGMLLVALVALLTVTTLTAGADDAGHLRALACHAGSVSGRSTPYAGAYYSVPLAATLALVLAIAALAARRVVDRPRGMAVDDADDDLLRRSSLSVVVAATGVAIAAPLTGVLLTTGTALHGISSGRPTCAPAWWESTGSVLMLLGLASLVLTVVFLGRLLGPSRVPAPLRHRTTVA